MCASVGSTVKWRECVCVLQGTIIVPNLELCNRDPEYWATPNQFNPDHFLDKEGKCQTRKDSYVPFSIGQSAGANYGEGGW